jgi:mitogen-activated protein kinase kinase
VQEREPFVQAAKRTPVDLQEWAIGLMERHNRKSHLAPQLSPATQDLLRGSDSPTGDYPDVSQTPTSGDIPIGGTNLISPREQIINTINSTRSPALNGSSRAAPAPFHPGLQRQTTTGSIPKSTTINVPEYGSGASSASNATFSHTLPMRPAPPGGPLPPPPPKKDMGDRRQAAYGAGGY